MLLKLEGTLSPADATLLEEICTDLREDLDYRITIDLTNVNYVSKESARILCRLKTMPGLEMQGMHLFVQQIIELTETAQTKGHERDGK